MKAEATYWNGKIWLRSNPQADHEYREAKDLARYVGAGRWHKREGAYAFPATVDTCYRLREAWGRDLVIMPPLAQWYRETARPEADAQALRTTLADAKLERLQGVAPALFATLRPDQRAGVAAIAATYRGSLIIAPQPGLGKTRQVIGGLLEADVRGSILILAPKLAVKRVWHREIREWTTEAGWAVYMARGNRASRQRAINRFVLDDSETKVLVCVADMLRVKREPLEDGQVKSDRKKRGRIEDYSYPDLYDRNLLGAHGWSTIVVDESHRLFGSLTVAKSTLAGEGLTKLPSHPSTRRYAVTGTPFGRGGRVTGMFGTLHWCWPDEFTSFWQWAERHFEVHDDEVFVRGGGGRTRTVRRIGKLRDDMDGEAFLKSLGPRILRVTKEEALPWLPPKQYVHVPCEMAPAQLRQYKELSDEGELITTGGPISANGVLAEITRARQVADGELLMHPSGTVRFTGESGKLDTFLEILEARGIVGGDQEGGEMKVVVASRFREFLDALCERLAKEKIPYHYLHGGVTDPKRDRMMDAFQALGGPRVFLLQSQAGGISVTLDAADELHMLDELDNPEDNEQVEDRIHRGTRDPETGKWRTHQCTIYYYRSEGTIDDRRAEDVEDKRKDQHVVLDGRRGLAYVREMIRYQPPVKEAL